MAKCDEHILHVNWVGKVSPACGVSGWFEETGSIYLLVPMLASKVLRRTASSESDPDKADAKISLLEYLMTFRTYGIISHVMPCIVHHSANLVVCIQDVRNVKGLYE